MPLTQVGIGPTLLKPSTSISSFGSEVAVIIFETLPRTLIAFARLERISQVDKVSIPRSMSVNDWPPATLSPTLNTSSSKVDTESSSINFSLHSYHSHNVVFFVSTLQSTGWTEKLSHPLYPKYTMSYLLQTSSKTSCIPVEMPCPT